MVCRPCQESRVRANEAYTWRMTGEGRSFKDQQRERVLCLECGKKMEKGSLVTHRQTQHSVEKGGLGPADDKASRGNNPRTSRMEFPAKAGPRPCAAEGCSRWLLTRTAMRVHFWHWHVRDTMVIMEEFNLPHPLCPLCDMLVTWRDLNGTHLHTVQCKWVAEQKRRKLAAEEEREVTARSFSSYGLPLYIVTSVRYLGQVILKADNNFPAVVRNLSRAR